MFNNLSDKPLQSLKTIRGQAKITEKNIQDALSQVRIAFLEADVALSIADAFIAKVKARALGQEVTSSLNPEQTFIKIVQQELIETIGGTQAKLDFKQQPPIVILLVGLQGAGKTTTAAKLAWHLKQKHRKRVLLASVDTYRPAAIEQLSSLAQQINTPFFPVKNQQKPLAIAEDAIEEAYTSLTDIIIIDTAGRTQIDQHMMDELKALQQQTKPVETLFVVDAMTGQDAVNSIQGFTDIIDLTGIILTKADGDTRGGVALSAKAITGKPIKFMGVGEKIDALEPFHPERIASRILDMGDMLSLIEKVESQADTNKAKQLAQRIKKGKEFNFHDLADQLKQMQKLGGIKEIMSRIPGMGQQTQLIQQNFNDKTLVKMLAMIGSMTRQEKKQPGILNNSRKQRICKGSGCNISELNRLMKQQKQMTKMLHKTKNKKGMDKMMRQMQQMGVNGKQGFPGLM